MKDTNVYKIGGTMKEYDKIEKNIGVLWIQKEPLSITWESLKSKEWLEDQACLAMLEPLA